MGRNVTIRIERSKEKLMFIATTRAIKDEVLLELFCSGGQYQNLRSFWLNGKKI
jgi:hypothetical protein